MFRVKATYKEKPAKIKTDHPMMVLTEAESTAEVAGLVVEYLLGGAVNKIEIEDAESFQQKSEGQAGDAGAINAEDARNLLALLAEYEDGYSLTYTEEDKQAMVKLAALITKPVSDPGEESKVRTTGGLQAELG